MSEPLPSNSVTKSSCPPAQAKVNAVSWFDSVAESKSTETAAAAAAAAAATASLLASNPSMLGPGTPGKGTPSGPHPAAA